MMSVEDDLDSDYSSDHDSDFEGHDDPHSSKEENVRAHDFIMFKSTLIREYSSRKDKLRKRYRHHQISDDQLLHEYTQLVRWYVDTRQNVQEDFQEYEWEIDTRNETDIVQLAKQEVEALIELRKAGPVALDAGSNVSEKYMESLYGGGGSSRKSSRIQTRHAQGKPFTGQDSYMVGHNIEVQYDDGEWWEVAVVSYDKDSHIHTVVGRDDREPILGFEHSSMEDLRNIASSDNVEDGFYVTKLDLRESAWRLPEEEAGNASDEDYHPDSDLEDIAIDQMDIND